MKTKPCTCCEDAYSCKSPLEQENEELRSENKKLIKILKGLNPLLEYYKKSPRDSRNRFNELLEAFPGLREILESKK